MQKDFLSTSLHCVSPRMLTSLWSPVILPCGLCILLPLARTSLRFSSSLDPVFCLGFSLLCGTCSVVASLGSVHRRWLWDLVYLRMFWWLSKLDGDPKLQPSFTIVRGLLCGLLASVDISRTDALLILHVFCVWLLPLRKMFWEAFLSECEWIASVLNVHDASSCLPLLLWTI